MNKLLKAVIIQDDEGNITVVKFHRSNKNEDWKLVEDADSPAEKTAFRIMLRIAETIDTEKQKQLHEKLIKKVKK